MSLREFYFSLEAFHEFYLLGIGLDSAVIPLKKNNLFLVQSVDFFYPLCDSGELMGKSK